MEPASVLLLGEVLERARPPSHHIWVLNLHPEPSSFSPERSRIRGPEAFSSPWAHISLCDQTGTAASWRSGWPGAGCGGV